MVARRVLISLPCGAQVVIVMAAVVGIDPGRRWTAGVLRVDADAVHGWTVGPVDAAGRPAPTASDNVHDLAGWARYMERVLTMVEATLERHQAAGGERPHVAVEVAVPRGGRIALADWLVPRQIVAGLLAWDPDVLLVAPARHGRAHYAEDERGRLVRTGTVAQHYPPALWPAKGHTGGRPASWGPLEARRGERDHERAAFDIAGAGAVMLAEAGR